MAQLNTQQAASLGSQLTGLPVAFVQALIQEEGTINNGHNNPFDVTSGWAAMTSYPALPGQDWGSQGNIASFPDTETAVRAWAQGINTFGNYSAVRYAIQSGISDFGTLAASFGNAYSGGSSTWASNVVSIANSLAAQGVSTFSTMPTDTIQAGSTGSSGETGTVPPSSLSNLVSSISLPGSDIPSALNNLASQVSTAVNNATQGITQLHDFVSWLGQPNLWARIILTVIGVIVLILGLIFFALSFTHTKMPAVVPV